LGWLAFLQTGYVAILFYGFWLGWLFLLYLSGDFLRPASGAWWIVHSSFFGPVLILTGEKI